MRLLRSRHALAPKLRLNPPRHRFHLSDRRSSVVAAPLQAAEERSAEVRDLAVIGPVASRAVGRRTGWSDSVSDFVNLLKSEADCE